MVDSCFVNDYETTQKIHSFRLRLKSAQHSLRSNSHFRSMVNKRGTHRADNFLKYLCEMVYVCIPLRHLPCSCYLFQLRSAVIHYDILHFFFFLHLPFWATRARPILVASYCSVTFKFSSLFFLLLQTKEQILLSTFQLIFYFDWR